MIQTTNDTREFIEEHNEPIFIYGAGNPGTWVGTYMQRCGIAFEGYLDRACTVSQDTVVNHIGVRVYHPKELERYRNTKVRIIIAVADVKGVLADLHWYAGENDLYCLVPLYSIFGQEGEYNINFLLGYFRSCLLKVKVPTIISNQCDAGMIYRMLQMPIKSPTINMAFQTEDFLKLCENPGKYLEQDMVLDGQMMARFKGMGSCPAAKVGDLSVMLRHDCGTAEEGVKRWNTLKKWVDYDNLIFIMSDVETSGMFVTQQQQREFMKLPGKKLLILTKSMYMLPEFAAGNVLYTLFDCFLNFESPVENYFDILGWINGDF